MKKEFTKKEFTRDYLVNELGLPWTAVENNIIYSSRWSVRHEIVFQDTDGRFYKTTYRVGATECQDEYPWEYENIVKCIEVEKRKVIVEKWMPLPKPSEED